jgi:hypothetical protein
MRGLRLLALLAASSAYFALTSSKPAQLVVSRHIHTSAAYLKSVAVHSPLRSIWVEVRYATPQK